MIGLGTIINVVAILVGGVIGLEFSRAISARYQETLMQAIGSASCLWASAAPCRR